MKTVSFLFGENDERITGEVLKEGAKTVVVKTTLPEDYGEKTITIKRHLKKHQVEEVE